MIIRRLFFLLTCTLATVAALGTAQRAALLQICATTNIGSKTNWCSVQPACDWDGLVCNELKTSLLEFRIGAEPVVTGVISVNFGVFVSLQVLEILSPGIAGSLPNGIDALSTLREVRVQHTLIDGAIPAAYTTLGSALRTLVLAENDLAGPLPSDWSGLPQLRHLDLSGNNLQGAVPVGLRQLVFLEHLDLSHNRLTGAWPAELCSMVDLDTLFVQRNRLNETLPVCLGQLNPAARCDFRENLFCDVPPAGLAPCHADQEGVIDRCGVCGGDGLSCVDCEYTLQGSKQYDACGVCGGDDSSCADCAGTPNGPLVVDACGVCGGQNACLDCEGTPSGTAQYDQCDVCGGDDSTCTDCAGVVLGPAAEDACGVCQGDGSSCADCEGTPNGPALYDRCGVCSLPEDADATCLDCTGILFGTRRYDRCGVCGGNGATCGIHSIINSEGEQYAGMLLAFVVVISILCIFAALLFATFARGQRRSSRKR